MLVQVFFFEPEADDLVNCYILELSNLQSICNVVQGLSRVVSAHRDFKFFLHVGVFCMLGWGGRECGIIRVHIDLHTLLMLDS